MTAIDALAAEVAAASDRDGWLAAMDRAGEEAGYFQRVGKDHWAYFGDDSPTLLVGFETVETAMARPGRRPLIQPIAERNGWSHLTLIADGTTFWRDPAVWAYVDRLVDDAFFEDFDRVLFYGAGAGGYAAATFAVAAPGASALLLGPRATMAPAIAGWDPRDPKVRRRDFTSRYGYAPDMIEGLTRVFLAYDPQDQLDAMHAALFRKPFVTPLPLARCNAGGGIEATLSRLGVLEGLIEKAALAQLTPHDVARAWRARRQDAAYLKATLLAVAEKDSPELEEMYCRAVLSRVRVPRIERHLIDLTTRRPR